MALVAIRAVVNVVAHTVMIRIGLALGMATRASKYGVVGWVGVTGGAHAIGSAMVRRKPGVIEGRPLPRSGGVTGLAGRGEVRRRMVRIGRGLIVSFVAGIAVRRDRGVVVVYVTTGASDRGVLARKRERRIVVVE
jgi:hypothetical protein